MNNKIVKSMISVTGIVLVAKAFGFVKQMVTANAFGATIDTDIISISEGLISNVDFLLIQALSTAFIPTYIQIKKDGEAKSKVFISNIIKFFLLITSLLSLLFVVASPLISRILAPTYSLELSGRLSLYIKILSPVLILIVGMAVFNSLLKANEHFIPGELIGLIQSVLLIALVFIFGKAIGPDILVIGFIAYAVIDLVYLMICSKGMWILSKGNPFLDSNVIKMLRMMGPLLLGYSLVFVNQQIDKMIVSGLGEGTITAMNYAAVLSNFITTFVASICSVSFTYVAKSITDKNEAEAANLTKQSTIQMVTLLLPISILTVANAYDIVMVVFGRGEFVGKAVLNCSYALIGYGLMFVPFVLRELFSRFLYSYGDSKTPMINSAISIAINIILSIVLSRYIGVLGVTLATSFSVLVCAILNIVSSNKRNSHLVSREYLSPLPKWIVGGIICLAVSIVGQLLLKDMNSYLRLIVIVGVSFVGYGILTYSVLKPLIHKIMKK